MKGKSEEEKARCSLCYHVFPVSELDVEPCCGAPDCDMSIRVCAACSSAVDDYEEFFE